MIVNVKEWDLEWLRWELNNSSVFVPICCIALLRTIGDSPKARLKMSSALALNLKSLVKMNLFKMVRSDFVAGSALFLGGIGASALLIAVCPCNLLKDAVENDKTRPYACCRP